MKLFNIQTQIIMTKTKNDLKKTQKMFKHSSVAITVRYLKSLGEL